jgi:hypothetical protein
MGHIFRNCEFSVGLTLTGVVSAGNYDIQFIDCIIRGLTISETFVSPYGNSFFRRCNFKYQSINALQSNTVDVILEDCVNIPDDLETISPNFYVNGSAQYVNDHYYLNSAKFFYLSTNYVDITPTLDNELTSKFYVDTDIHTKQDTITSATDLTCNSITASSAIVNSVDIGSGFSSLQTQVDALIEYITNVGFRVFSLSADTISSGNNLVYNEKDYDTENGYNTTTFTYTISLAGTYIFTLGVYNILNTAFTVNLIRKTGSVETIIQQITNGTNTGNNTAYVLTTITQCSVGDEVFGFVNSGSLRLNPFNLTSPSNFTSFSGSRISN